MQWYVTSRTIQTVILLRYGPRPLLGLHEVRLHILVRPAFAALCMPSVILRWGSASVCIAINARRSAETKARDEGPTTVEPVIHGAIKHITVFPCG